MSYLVEDCWDCELLSQDDRLLIESADCHVSFDCPRLEVDVTVESILETSLLPVQAVDKESDLLLEVLCNRIVSLDLRVFAFF